MDIFNTQDYNRNEPNDSDSESEAPFETSSDSSTDTNSNSPSGVMPQTPFSISSESTLYEIEEEHLLEHPSASSIQPKVREVLKYLDSKNFKIIDFLDGLSWGDMACTQDPKIRTERSLLLNSPKLGDILHRWCCPPRPAGSSKARPKGAFPTMHEFAVGHIGKEVDQELEQISALLKSPTAIDVEENTLTNTSFEKIAAEMEKSMPTLWKLLDIFLYRNSQRKRNQTKTSSEKIKVIFISVLSYSRSHHRNRFQKLLAIYLKFKGISAKGFDTLHAMGLTMSHKWTCDVVERISTNCMKEVQELINNVPSLLSYDNLQLALRVFSQRLDHQGEFGNGTAATVYFKRDARMFTEITNKNLQKHRAQGQKNPLTALDILLLGQSSANCLQEFAIHYILRFLLDSPEFNIKLYGARNSPLFNAPPPVDALPCGPAHRTLQYLLGTVNIPKASYEDNERLVREWISQLGWNTLEEHQKTGQQRLMVWCGDQLTVDRLRGLFKFHAEDNNSFERLDFSIFVFGWLHCQMAFANSLYKQYFGTTQGRGLHQAFVLLQKKGLSKLQTKGPFHHDLQETLYEVAEAHFLEDWLEVTKARNIAELRNYTPLELVTHAKHILVHRASSQALNAMEHRKEEDRDEQLQQIIMWNCDILQYIILDHAISSGDVGLIEHMLPYLFFQFHGGGNGKYATEIIELLQGLHREWPPEVCDFVRHHCWVINTTGKPNMFCAVDKAQEHNIKDMKVTYRSEGPNIKWEYFKKLHPAIHIIRLVTDHIEKEFGTLARARIKNQGITNIIEAEK
ncbi:hypothetical protein JR316_0012069 [Psilocybe cubensis]|uniref:Uncharacterized protein n=1 Tax=Psilocybe cubensis TaxID=181762 RepID=A0ACB8GGW2_PSICU|nr:hypothetical protein JR316_0012069 [Psilocybe cubensis]KAH9474970.1 hypothetical protein JR316_0012069 [Psilocybe cubensis]